MKYVKIPRVLFLDLCEYFFTLAGCDSSTFRGRFEKFISDSLYQKLNDLIQHETYSEYVKAVDPDEKKRLFQIYFDESRGIRHD